MFKNRKIQYCQDVVLSNLTYRFSILLIKIPANYFCAFRQTYSKVYMERQKNNQHNIESEEQSQKTDTT